MFEMVVAFETRSIFPVERIQMVLEVAKLLCDLEIDDPNLANDNSRKPN